jgi:hypothetical protein
MSKSEPQSLKNHGRVDPWFHFFTFGLYLANLAFAITHLVRHHHSHMAIWYVVVSAAIIVPILKIRMYALKVQDRIIRLEERLRLQSLAPADFKPQIAELSEDQLIGLRFASDEEVAGLAQQALEVALTRKQIKERIRNWRADNWRI